MSKPTTDKNIEVPMGDLMGFLTPSEIRMLKNRWQIANLLAEGQTVRSIAEIIGVGTDTVVRVSKMLESNGPVSFKKKKTKKIKSSTPWIFGKSD